MLWAADKDIWQVYGGRVCGVMQGRTVRSMDALVHGSMLSATHYWYCTISPWPIFVLHTLKSIFCTFHARKKLNKCEKLRHFATHSGSWYLPVYPLKCHKKQVEVGTFYTVVLSCFVINTRVGCYCYSLKTKKMWIPEQQHLHKWQLYSRGSHIQYIPQRPCGQKREVVEVVLMWLQRHWGKVTREREYKCMRHKEKLDLFCRHF